MSTFLYRFLAFIVFICVICTPESYAQQVPDAQFGSIPDSLFQIQHPPDDEDASYMITNKELDISFRETGESIVAILQHHFRLKVFDETAPEASIITIPYYFDNEMEQISSIKAYTHLPSGEQIPLKEQDIRTININPRYNVKEFTMPAVEDGAILEYSYEIERRYIEELPDFFLSHKVPTSNAKLTITYPRYLRYQAHTENYDGSLQHDFVYTDTSSVPKIFMVPQPQPIVTERWIAQDIPGITEEAFISSLDDYRAKIKFMLSEFGIPRQQLENSWEVVVARIRKKTNPWQQIRENALAEVKGDSIARSLTDKSKEVVQDSIYQYLNQRINFSGSYSPYSTEPDENVLIGKSVDQAAINQTLVAMLRGAGIEANPVMISTEQSGKINMDFPSFYQFNGQLVQSEISGQKYLMDASFSYSQPGLIPADMYGSRGLILTQDSFEWIDIHPDKSNFEIQVQIDAELRSNGTLVGTVNATQRGYPAQLIRQRRADGSSYAEILRQTLFDGYPRITTDSVHIENINNHKQPIDLFARFEIQNYATSFTDGLKFRPMIVGYQSENPFGDTSRKFPITFDAPEKLDISYSISLPPGYSVEERKQNQDLAFPGAEFRESYDMKRGRLDYGYNIGISQKEFSPEFFPQLYDLYKRWAELSNSAWLIEN
jgi:hypothetical protein